MSKTPPLKWRNSFAFTESGGGEVKHERIQTGVEGAGQECVVPPRRAVVAAETHQMGQVVG